jgi:hypothetical protein
MMTDEELQSAASAIIVADQPTRTAAETTNILWSMQRHATIPVHDVGEKIVRELSQCISSASGASGASGWGTGRDGGNNKGYMLECRTMKDVKTYLRTDSPVSDKERELMVKTKAAGAVAAADLKPTPPTSPSKKKKSPTKSTKGGGGGARVPPPLSMQLVAAPPSSPRSPASAAAAAVVVAGAAGSPKKKKTASMQPLPISPRVRKMVEAVNHEVTLFDI